MTEQRIIETKERLENIGNDEQELAKKIDRRKRELDQLQKRLAKLQVKLYETGKIIYIPMEIDKGVKGIK